jgi:acyl-CoA synthetase (AMP-forming)/AMP-acid ligase II
LSYGELLDRAAGMVAALDRMGVGQGERVAIVSPNCAKFLIALFAVTTSGRILVPINFRLSVDEVRFIVEDADAKVLLVDPELDEPLASIGAPHRVRLDGEADAELFAPGEGDLDQGDLDEHAPATLNYTSGTTSTPKGVVLTHRSQWLNAVTLGWELGCAPGDVYLHTLPQFHVNGWGLPLVAAAMGIPNIVLRAVRGDEILRRVDAHGVTLMCGAAPVVNTVTEAAEQVTSGGGTPPGHGRTRMVSGGAATSALAIERFERATGWEMIHAYGLTETGPVLTVNRVPRSGTDADTATARGARLEAVGRPLVGVRLHVADDGEVLAHGSKLFAGYWRRPDLTEESYRDGWLKTGDGGRWSDRMLWITDRKKDVIVSGGENISPSEVETCLERHPAVKEVAVIAVPHERWGETPMAIIVPEPGETPSKADLIAFCRSHLAGFKCPTEVDYAADLPRTATGKVQKHVLRARYGQAPGPPADPTGYR